MQRISRMRFDRLMPVFLALLLVGIVAGRAFGASEKTEYVLKGKLRYSSHTPVKTPFAGVITGLESVCGDKVEEGQVLGWVELNEQYWYNLKTKLIRRQETIAKQSGRRKMELEKERLLKKQKAEQALIDKGFSVKETLEGIALELKLLDNAMQEYDANLKEQKADLHQELKELKKLFNKKVVPSRLPQKAPIVAEAGGYIVFISSNAQNGSEIGKNATIMTISQVDPMIVEAQVFEREVVKLKIGDTAEIRVDSLKDKTYEATLKKISWIPIQRSFDKPSYYEIELEMKNTDLEMKEGFQVQVVFEL